MSSLIKAAKLVLIASALTDRIKKEGDVHIQNVKRFFGKWVEKSDPLRDAVKAVVFGVIYGKGAETLGNDTKKAELDVLKAKMGEAHKAKDTATLEKLEAEYEALLEEDRSEKAQLIIDKLMTEFQNGAKWLERMSTMAKEKFYVFSPLGKIRHLYAAMTEDKKIVARQVRRGMNAPIQGFASEVSVKASRMMMLSYYDTLEELKELLGLEGEFPIKFNRIVHDAIYLSVPYAMVLPFIHILQYDATYGIAETYEKEFGLKFTIEPEIELEVGVKDTLSHKWGWALPELVAHLDKAVTEGLELKLLTGNKEEIMATIMEPWKNKKVRKLLNDRFPLLGVDLYKEIGDVVV